MTEWWEGFVAGFLSAWFGTLFNQAVAASCELLRNARVRRGKR